MSTRRKPGVVRDAIIKFLKKRKKGAHVSEIHEAVCKTLKDDNVPKSSVRSYLRLNTHGMFKRIERGQYKLEW